MNIKGIENLKLSAFARTKLMVRVNCPVGDFWLAGDNFKGKIEGEAIFGAEELLKIANSENPSKWLCGLIRIKKQLPVKLMEVKNDTENT